MIPETHSRRSYLKLTVDIIMAVVFALLLNVRVLSGLTFHEWAGTLIGLAFALHVSLNWKWVVSTTLRLLKSAALAPKVRLGYWLNWLLLLAMGFIIVSGLLISRELFPGLRLNNGRWIQRLHITIAFLILGFVGVHVGLHASWLIGLSRRIASNFQATRWWQKTVLAAIVLGLAAGLVFLPTRNQAPPIQAAAPTVEGEPHRPEDAFFGKESERGEQHREPNDRPRRDRGRDRGRRGEKPHPARVVGFYVGILSLFAAATALIENRITRSRFPESSSDLC